jgi:hypothetical protein
MERTLTNQDCINILTAFVTGQNTRPDELEVCANPPPCKEPRQERTKFKRQYCAWESKSDEPKPDKRRLQSLVSKLKSQSLNVLPSIAVKTLSPEEIAQEKLKTVYKNVKDADAIGKLQDWRKEYARPFNNLRTQGWSPVEQLTADMSKLNIGSQLASLGVPPGAPNLPPLQPLPIAEQKQEAEPVPYEIQDLVDAQEAANIQGNLLQKMTESFTEVQDDTSKNMLLIVEKMKQENEALKQQLADQTLSKITEMMKLDSKYISPMPTIVGIPVLVTWGLLKYTIIQPLSSGASTVFAPVKWLWSLFVFMWFSCFVINAVHDDESVPYVIRYIIQTVYNLCTQGIGYMGGTIIRTFGRSLDGLINVLREGGHNIIERIASLLDRMLNAVWVDWSLQSRYHTWRTTPYEEAKAEAPPPPPYNEDDEPMPEGWEEHLLKMEEAVKREKAGAQGAIPQIHEPGMDERERQLFKALDESLSENFAAFARQISVFAQTALPQGFNIPSADNPILILPTALPAFFAAHMFIASAPPK